MKESNSPIVHVKNIKLSTFKGIFSLSSLMKIIAFLRFLYQNIIELTEPLASDLYGIADEYMQTELMEICETFLCKNITLENLMGMVDLVQKFGGKSLKNSILELIAKNLEILMENQTYYLLPCSFLWEVALKLKNEPQFRNQ